MSARNRQDDAETSALADFLAIYRKWRRSGHPRRKALCTAWRCVWRSP